MNKVLNFAFIAIAAIILTACADNYRDELDAKLANAGPDKKQQTLAAECKEQIEKHLDLSNPASVTHAHNMQAICEQMTGEQLDIKYSASN